LRLDCYPMKLKSHYPNFLMFNLMSGEKLPE
jgi:hypothetical protein